MSKKLGISEIDVAKRMGITVPELRAKEVDDREHLRDELYIQVKKLKEEGLSTIEISNIIGLKESCIRTILNDNFDKSKVKA